MSTALEDHEILQNIADNSGRIADSLAILVTYARPEPASPSIPSRYARVHAMGHDSFVGEVEALERGGYRVRWPDADISLADVGDLAAAYKGPGPWAKLRVKDIRAVYSVDWIDEAEYQRFAEQVQERARRNIERLYHDECYPEGYEPVTAPIAGPRHGFRRISDGKVYGFERSPREVQQLAWSDAQDDLGDWPDRRAALLPDLPTTLRWWHGDTLMARWQVPALGEHLVVDERTPNSNLRIHVLITNTPEGITITDQGSSAYLTHVTDGEPEDVPLGRDGARTAPVAKGDTFAVASHLLVFGEDDKPSLGEVG